MSVPSFFVTTRIIDCVESIPIRLTTPTLFAFSSYTDLSSMVSMDDELD